LSTPGRRLAAFAQRDGAGSWPRAWLARSWLARSWLRAWLRGAYAPASPLPLALLRIGVALIILISPEPGMALRIASGPRELWLAPPSLGWFVPIFAWCAPHLVLARRLLQASALLSLLGLWTRASLSVLALTFFVLFGGAQLSGAVVHDMHLGWLLLVLILGPAGQALSLDAWAQGERLWPLPGSPLPASIEAGLATRFARLLLGFVYFFPGLHKLLDGGLGWASSHNLENQLWLKWFQAGGALPWPRVDRLPWLLSAGGVLVLCFELGFIACLTSRRGRALGAAMGLAFHALTQHFMFIRFPSLWACYGVLWSGPRAAAARGAEPLAPASRRRAFALSAVGGALSLAVIVQGVRGETQSWPLACYPSFSAPAPDRIADLAVELQLDGAAPTGTGVRVLRVGPLPPSPGARRSPADWSRVWTLAGLYGAPASPLRLQAFGSELARRAEPSVPLESVRRVRFYVESYAIAPENYGQPPLSRRLLHEAAAL
jgi:hypothetical protein